MPVFFLVLFLFFVIGIFRKLSFRNRYFCLLIVNIFRHSAFVTLRFTLFNCGKYLHSNSHPVISVSDALQRLAMIDMASSPPSSPSKLSICMRRCFSVNISHANSFPSMSSNRVITSNILFKDSALF